MKYIECKLPVKVKVGSEWEERFLTSRLPWSEQNEAWAAEHAENGVYTIVEVIEPTPQPTVDEILNALLGVTE